MLDPASNDVSDEVGSCVRERDDVEAEAAAPVRCDRSSDGMAVDELEELVRLVSRPRLAPPPLDVSSLPHASGRVTSTYTM